MPPLEAPSGFSGQVLVR